METLLRFAVIGVNALEGVALRRILSDDLGAHADIYCRFTDFEPHAERADAFVVSSDVILLNLDFFMPRKQRVVAVTSSEGVGKLPFLVLNKEADEKEIVGILRKAAESAHEDTTVQGELSSRELDVLREVARGKTNKEIADTLCISINTVITHRRNVSLKLGIRSASGLSLYALMNGII